MIIWYTHTILEEMNVNRRNFLKILSAIPAALALPAFAKNNRFADYDLISDDRGGFARVSAFAIPSMKESVVVKLHFRKDGYPNITKVVNTNPSSRINRKSEVAYQILKRCEEASRDYAYAQYGVDFHEHETVERRQNQMTVFVRDLEKFNL